MTASRSSRRTALVASALFAGLAAVAVVSACSAGQLTQTGSQVAAVPGANANVGPDNRIALRNLTVAYSGPQGYPRGSSAPLVVRIFNDGTQPVRLVSVTAEDFAQSVNLVSGPTAAQAGAASSTSPATAPPAASGSPSRQVVPPTATLSPARTASGALAATPTRTPSSAASVSLTPTAPRGAAATALPSTPAAAAQTPAPVGFPITIPPSSYVLLVPGQDTYLQLTGLARALLPGESVRVTFTFDQGRTAIVQVPMGPPDVPQPRPTGTGEPVEPHHSE